MGYMGFGMRKEVYQSKPKKAFEKLKKYYEKEAKSSRSKDLILSSFKLKQHRKEQIRKRIQRQQMMQIWLSIAATLVVMAAVVYFGNDYIEDKMEQRSERIRQESQVTKLFRRKVYSEDGVVYRIEDHYKGGGLASSVRIKDGMKHQNSESYYPTGQQFRSALYFYDSLVIDYYFYKNGDTISNFPVTDPEKTYHIQLSDPVSGKTIKFDLLDHKIIVESYQERFEWQ